MSKEFNQNTISGDFEFSSLREAVNYQRLLIKELGASVRGRTIEIGSGLGHMTAALRALPGIEYLQCIEPEPAFCAQFRRTFPDQPLIQGTTKDMPRDDWDAIVSINVLEHIENDEEELALYHERLKRKRGALALFVPARPELYAPIDRDFGHYRRYRRPEVVAKLTRAGFKIERIRYFDFAGYFAWLVSHRLLRQRNFKPASVRWFDRVIFPVENFMECKICPPPIGKNLLVIARAI
jgi:hypothetical protein